MTELLRLLLGLSVSGTLLALLLTLLRRLFGARLPSVFYYGAWLLVLLRFLVPLPGLVQKPRIQTAPEAPVLIERTAANTTRPYEAGFVHVSAPRPETPADALPVVETVGSDATAPEKTAPAGLSFAELARVITAPRFLFTLWLVGVAVSAVWQLGGYLRFRRELERSLRPARPADRALYESLARRPRPKLCRSCAVATPMLVGVLRPLIVLPEREYSETMLRGILAHELTHYRRGDVAVKWLAVLAGLVHWFNPVLRLLRVELDRACELSCDERLLRGMDAGEKRLYGDMLLTLAARRPLSRTVVATSFAVEKRNLKERLVQIMTYRKYSRAAIALALAMMLLLSACGAAIGPQTLRNTQTLAASVSDVPPTPQPDEAERSGVTVSNIDELLAALAPNAIIFLAPGVYNLADAKDYGRTYDEGCYTWNDAYDGYELVIRNLDGLVLTGLPGDTGAEIVINAEPRYAEVLRFENCRDLLLSTLTLGHTQEPGQCAGGVVELDSCSNVRILSCKLYGCGVMGVTAQNCDTVRVEESAIYECSSGAVWCRGTRDFRLLACDVYNCPGKADMQAYALFDVMTSTGFAVVNSHVRDNRAMTLLRSTSSDEVYFLGNEVTGNRVASLFSSNLIAPIVEGCAFTGNSVSEQALEGLDALVNRTGEAVSAAELETMTLSHQDYEGPKVRAGAAVTGIPTQDGTEYHVTTVDELLSCIGPDTTIYLDAETFNWTDAETYGGYGSQYYYWIDNYDGPSLVITGVENLRLIGQGKEETTVLAEPRYADVIAFENCAHITVANLTAGHTTAPAYCMGDVLGFQNCEDVHIVDCGLFGCGVWGIRANDCVQGDILRTEIYECSEGAVIMSRTSGFVFTDCSVHDCAGEDWNSSKMTAHNYMSVSDCGDITYNGTPIPTGGVWEIGDGHEPQSLMFPDYEAETVYTPEEFLHLFYFNAEVSQGFTLYVGDEVQLDVVPPYYVDDLEFVWGVSDAARLSLTVSESSYSCTLKALKPVQGGVTLTVTYGDMKLNVPVYIREA